MGALINSKSLATGPLSMMKRKRTYVLMGMMVWEMGGRKEALSMRWIKVEMRPMMEWWVSILTVVLRMSLDLSRMGFDLFQVSHPLSTWSYPFLRTRRSSLPHPNSFLYLLNSLIQSHLLLLNRTFRNQRLLKMALWKEKQNQLDVHWWSWPFEFIPFFQIFHHCPAGHPIRVWFSAQFLVWRTKWRCCSELVVLLGLPTPTEVGLS